MTLFPAHQTVRLLGDADAWTIPGRGIVARLLTRR